MTDTQARETFQPLLPALEPQGGEIVAPTRKNAPASILLDRDELLTRRDMGLHSSNLDYCYMAIELDYPGQRCPSINATIFAERWSTEDKPISEADVAIALGRLSKKKLLNLPSLKIDVTFSLPDSEAQG